ncbi:MAG: diaminopimelate epimerase [Bacteroidales bacterium]|jgi:diaminopimelate epimerase|nr:diaminopimelate epimerase [Bacteroidales bacterium]
MKLTFDKYEGAGNDFIVIRNSPILISRPDMLMIANLCDRHFGIGADGLILVEECEGYDFRMHYFNSDGSPGAMCGNGARCASHFAMRHLTGFRELTFLAGDGPHTARPAGEGKTEVSITDVNTVRYAPDGILVNTGVPHLVVFTDDNTTADMVSFGRALRWSPAYAPEGVNVNLVSITGGKLTVRTYERGVEDETLACGTGITASAIAAAYTGKIVTSATEVIAKGGTVSVRFTLTETGATDIFLAGPASFVFSGAIEVQKT